MCLQTVHNMLMSRGWKLNCSGSVVSTLDFLNPASWVQFSVESSECLSSSSAFKSAMLVSNMLRYHKICYECILKIIIGIIIWTFFHLPRQTSQVEFGSLHLKTACTWICLDHTQNCILLLTQSSRMFRVHTFFFDVLSSHMFMPWVTFPYLGLLMK